MICAFGWLAINAKRRIPNAHTLLELIRARYGTPAHILWIVLCLINNLLIFSQMIVGAAAAVNSLTGMHIVAASYLLPLGVVIYTYFGGIRATFLTDYVHTFIIMIVLVWFTIKLIAAPGIGSIGALYDLVKPLSDTYPVAGNHEGSFLTMTSKESIFFGIIHTTYVNLTSCSNDPDSISAQTQLLSSSIRASGRRASQPTSQPRSLVMSWGEMLTLPFHSLSEQSWDLVLLQWNKPRRSQHTQEYVGLP